MKSLINLKEWLTITDAAKYLTADFNEDITEADVLRLGLDGRLRLSVHFVNHASARCGDFIKLKKWRSIHDSNKNKIPWTTLQESLVKSEEFLKNQSLTFRMTVEIDPATGHCYRAGGDLNIGKFLRLSNEVEILRGVFDLPLIGNERLDVERAYQQLTGGPVVTARELGGTIVTGRKGRMYQLQERYEKCYRPVRSLPTDAVIIVRTESLKELSASLETHESDDTIAARMRENQTKRGVSLDVLKLYTWPLNGKKDDERLVCALRRSKWVERAVVCKDPLMVNPAELAYALQDKTKTKLARFFIPAKQLGNYLAAKFPEYFDEYELLIDYEKNL